MRNCNCTTQTYYVLCRLFNNLCFTWYWVEINTNQIKTIFYKLLSRNQEEAKWCRKKCLKVTYAKTHKKTFFITLTRESFCSNNLKNLFELNLSRAQIYRVRAELDEPSFNDSGILEHCQKRRIAEQLYLLNVKKVEPSFTIFRYGRSWALVLFDSSLKSSSSQGSKPVLVLIHLRIKLKNFERFF